MSFHKSVRDESVFLLEQYRKYLSTKEVVYLQVRKVQILGLYFSGYIPEDSFEDVSNVRFLESNDKETALLSEDPITETLVHMFIFKSLSTVHMENIMSLISEP